MLERKTNLMKIKDSNSEALMVVQFPYRETTGNYKKLISKYMDKNYEERKKEILFKALPVNTSVPPFRASVGCFPFYNRSLTTNRTRLSDK